jgi:hypothetical protein
MPIAPLIVLERDGHWAAAMRREIDDPAIRPVEARSWDECWQRLAERPSALIVAELMEANIDSCLAALNHIDRRFPRAALVIVADRKLDPYRTLLREAGALHFITSPRRLGEVNEMMRRRGHLSDPATSTSKRLDEIIAELPWSDSVE